MQPLQYELRRSAAKDNRTTHAAAAPQKISSAQRWHWGPFPSEAEHEPHPLHRQGSPHRRRDALIAKKNTGFGAIPDLQASRWRSNSRCRWCGGSVVWWCDDVVMWCGVVVRWCGDVVMWWWWWCGDVVMRWWWWCWWLIFFSAIFSVLCSLDFQTSTDNQY